MVRRGRGLGLSEDSELKGRPNENSSAGKQGQCIHHFKMSWINSASEHQYPPSTLQVLEQMEGHIPKYF